MKPPDGPVSDPVIKVTAETRGKVTGADSQYKEDGFIQGLKVYDEFWN